MWDTTVLLSKISHLLKECEVTTDKDHISKRKLLNFMLLLTLPFGCGGVRHPPILYPVGKSEGSRKIQGCSEKAISIKRCLIIRKNWGYDSNDLKNCNPKTKIGKH